MGRHAQAHSPADTTAPFIVRPSAPLPVPKSSLLFFKIEIPPSLLLSLPTLYLPTPRASAAPFATLPPITVLHPHSQSSQGRSRPTKVLGASAAELRAVQPPLFLFPSCAAAAARVGTRR